MMRRLLLLFLFAAPLAVNAKVIPATPDMAELAAQIRSGQTSSEASVRLFRQRIAALDDAGPTLGAVLALMPDAPAYARKRDSETKAGKPLGPLHGIAVLIKDNIEVAGTVPTTAGSLALARNVTNRDAAVVKRLRESGAIILGKTNLSEWANIRSNESTSGWSAVGGLTRNPHVLNRSACGSSSGNGAAIAAGLAAGAVGTETDGSITCPAAVNGIVGFKPTLGLVSRTFIVPISHSQDTAGPMTRSVRDAALMLGVMAGSDTADAATIEADQHKTDYVNALSVTALKGKRIGVMRDRLGTNPGVIALFENALKVMKQLGADIVEIKDSRTGLDGLGEAEFTVLLYELKADLGHYLKGLPSTVRTRSLAEVIAFNKNNAAREMRWFGQDVFEMAQAKGTLDDPAYLNAIARSKKLAGPLGIDRLMAENEVDILVGITNGPAWSIDLVSGDHFAGPSAAQLPAVAGYPHLTVPMGLYENLPIGLSFVAGKWEDSKVLAMGYAYEQASHKIATPRFLTTLEWPQ
jgi:amidase